MESGLGMSAGLLVKCLNVTLSWEPPPPELPLCAKLRVTVLLVQQQQQQQQKKKMKKKTEVDKLKNCT